ncbi:sensor histidine kinase [Paenibacillus sp. TAB 01]|uniref:sensor histidine kinase n=1 Tax=Paenibacillus sp. TAB 01 TaxID=3368988 RepID=UPI0037518918
MTSLLNRMKDASGIGYTLNADIDDDELSAEGFELFYRVLQEAVTNVIRHSGATHVKVSLHKEEDRLVMRIRDNGAASSIDAIEEGFGLQVMKSRLSERGGKLSLAIAHPSGLEIQAFIPCTGQDKKEPEQEKEDCYAETGSH